MLWRNILKFLETEMETPKPYETFHIAWLIAAAVVIIFLLVIKRRNYDKQLKLVLGIYAIPAFILEALKQLIWSVEYSGGGIFTWDYQWYAFPFQLCTMPIYICLICLFLKKTWLRDSLLSFVAYTTILGSIASAIIPDSLFVADVLVNVHAMWLHLGSLVVSIYLFMSSEVLASRKNLLQAIGVFLIVVVLASGLNVLVYNSGVLKGETFNMLYISPYFESTLPVFSDIYNSVPYAVFLAIYILTISLGSFMIYLAAALVAAVKRKFS